MAEKAGIRTSVITATINQERSTAAPIIQEIFCDLNVIALSRAKLPHPIILPPFVGWVTDASSEVGAPEVDDSVEIIDKMLTG